MEELDLAITAAQKAGMVLMDHLGHLKDVRYKSRRDPVSEADRASEALIASIIKDKFPSHGFMVEEGAAWEGDGLWIVDPLDGTVNFAHGYPCFCVSIAFTRDGETLVGVVHDPVRDETYTATKGSGAFMNGAALRVSETATLERSLLVTGFPYDIEADSDRIMGQFSAMSLAAQGIRRDGSAALDLCHLASGKFDGYWELRLKPWDTAAGALILTEAGGVVTDFSGNPFRPEMKEILATNGRVHGEMMGVLGRLR
ncbi:MAG: inositol monophosphatase [Nitrospirae bacterium]|nr:inositol monophosphatase [Nitrospirota bacterium]